MIDLMSAVQAAVFATLAQAIDPAVAEVFDHVPQDFEGTFIKVGAIECVNEGSKDEQGERFEVEVHTIYRGTDRGVMLAAMHQIREALDEQPIAAPGADLDRPEFLGAAASGSPSPVDGRTYAGISTFEIYAEPA